MGTEYQTSTGYYGFKIQKKYTNPHVTFAPPMLLPKLKIRKKRFSYVNPKQRKTEHDFFMPTLTNRTNDNNNQAGNNSSPWKLANDYDDTAPGSMVREHTFARGQGSRQNNINFTSLPEGMDGGWVLAQKRRLDMNTDRRIVHHLRRKLNRRLERRVNQLVKREEAERIPTRKNTPVAPSPVDVFQSYTEFGDKIRDRKSGKSRPLTPAQEPSRPLTDVPKPDELTDLNRKTPLPDIKINQSEIQDGGDDSGETEEARKGETGKTFTLTGVSGDIVEPFIEVEPELEIPDVAVSPVPTPLLFRPETRQNGHVTLKDRRDRLLEGDVTVPLNPTTNVIRVYLQSVFTDSEVERTRLIETMYTKIRSMTQERGYDLHLVDLHWGHQDMTSDDHSQVSLVTKVIKRCKSRDQDINVMLFLGQKLGDTILPADIPVGKFEQLVTAAQEAREHHLAAVRLRAAAEDARRQDAVAKQRERLEAAEMAGTISVASQDGGQSSLSTRRDSQANSLISREPMRAELRRENSQGQMKEGIVTNRSSIHREPSMLRTVREASFDVDPDLLSAWYRRDDNASPPVYRLQRISSVYKDVHSADVKRRTEAKKQWTAVHSKLVQMLSTLSKQIFDDPQVIRKYNRTLTEVELEQSVSRDGDDVTSGCYWFHRHIEDIHLGTGDEKLRDYQDIIPYSVTTDADKQKTLADWRQYELPEAIPLVNRRKYKIPWNKKGITLTFRDHVNYIDRLCKDFGDVISQTIDHVSRKEAEIADVEDALYREVEQHVHHCQTRARMFHGRKPLLAAIKKYVRSPIPYPLVLYGKPGSGKTQLISKAARDCAKWLKGSSCTTLVRIIGVTSASLNVRMLLRYLCLQLCEVFGDNPADVPDDYKGLFNSFSFSLSKADESRQLVIFIDSLHLLSDENDGRSLSWLPKELPPHVHMVVSTLPDDSYLCLKALKRLIPEKFTDCFLEVVDLAVSEGMIILEQWLKKAGRSVTKEQRDVLVQSFRGCPQPLYLRALYREALTWSSFLPAGSIKLGNAVKNVTTVFIGRLERDHGEPLVRRALGYITAGRAGVTETEIEDLLSLDDAVIGDVVAHFKTPLRRLPSLLWVRLREELDEYLTETYADQCATLRWSNSAFYEAAEERYLNNKDKAPSYHKALSEYFSDMWTGIPKPYQGNEKGHHRYTLGQPLYRTVGNKKTKEVTRVYNLRRLNELPYHFLHSQQMSNLKKQCLCNFEFILAKISAINLRALLEDFQMALSVDPTDLDLKLLSDTLYLSLVALAKDPRQLASQIIGRMNDIITADVPAAPGDPPRYPALKPFFEQAKQASIPALIPSITCLTPPGGVLFDLLSGHTEPITAVCMSPDGQKCMTSAKDNTMKLWELRSGRVIKTIVGVGTDVLQIRIGGNYAIAATSEVSCIRLWSIRSCECLKVIDAYEDPASIVMAAEGMLLVAFYHGTDIMRVWGMGGRFSLIQEVFISEEQTTNQAVHQDESTIVGSNAHGHLVLHAFKNSSAAMVRNAKNGNVVLTLKVKESGCITAMACSPEYFILAVKYEYMEVHELYYLSLFDNRNGKFIRDVRGCVEDDVTQLFVNHMGSHALAICASEANNTSDIAVWNIETEEHKHVGKHAKVSNRGACMDLRYCLTAATDDSTLRIWNLSTMVNQSGNKTKVKNGLEDIILMTGNSRYVVAKSMNNGPIAVWNIAKGKCAGKAVHIERGLVNASDVMLVRNTKVLILTDKGFSNVSEDRPPVFQTMLIYDLLKKKYTQKLYNCYITPSPPHEYVFLDDEHFMGLADNRSHLVVWSTVTGHVIHRLKPTFKDLEKRARESEFAEAEMRRKKRATTAKMTPWDRRAETKSAKERRHQDEIAHERQRMEDLQRERENIIQQFKISQDLSTVVTAHYAHHLCVFDINTQAHIQTLENPNSMMILYIAALTENGSHLVHTNYDEEEKMSYLTLWDVKNGYVRKRLRNEKNVTCVDISRNAQRIVFGKSTKELRIWEPNSRGNSMRRIRGYPTLNFCVNSQIHLIEDGRQAVVYAGDISVWDLENATVLGVFTPDMRIQSFTPVMNGKLIAFGLQDTSDIVTLRLMSNKFRSIEPTGQDIFGEVVSSDEDDSDMEAQLDQDQDDD